MNVWKLWPNGKSEGSWVQVLIGGKKSNKKSIAITITWKTKKEGQRKAKRHVIHKNLKKERVNPSCGWKLSHP